jgi:hypothetical protein
MKSVVGNAAFTNGFQNPRVMKFLEWKLILIVMYNDLK